LVIYIDADASPVKSIVIEEAAAFQVKSVFVFSFANHLTLEGEWVETIMVDRAFQSADLYIVNHAKPGDLVVTDDYGLAGLILGRGCIAISSRGKEYTNENIDAMLSMRHHAQKARLAGRRTKGPKAMSSEHEYFFRSVLRNILQRNTL